MASEVVWADVPTQCSTRADGFAEAHALRQLRESPCGGLATRGKKTEDGHGKTGAECGMWLQMGLGLHIRSFRPQIAMLNWITIGAVFRLCC